MRTVVALYDMREKARDAAKALIDAGFPRDDISIASRGREGEDVQVESGRTRRAGTESGEGAVIGGGVGAILGGIGGLLVGLGTIVLPGAGLIVAAGPLVGLLTGLVAGGAAGGLLGALIGLGIPEEHAQVYAEGVRRGGTLVAVQTSDERAPEATAILQRFNPINIERSERRWREMGWEGYETEAGPLTAAQLQREQQAFAADRRREMPEAGIDEEALRREQQTFVGDRRREIPGERIDEEALRREQQTFVGGRQRDITDQGIDEEALQREQRTFATERRREMTDEGVDEEVRRHEEEFRRHYETRLSGTGRDFSYFRPAYIYGCKLAHTDPYSIGDWPDIESEARRRWRETNGDESWLMVEDAVRTSYRACHL